MQSFFWTFGRFLCGGLAWIILPQAAVNIAIGSLTIHSWRVYIAVTALPSLIGALLYFLLPESPRFLLEVSEEGGNHGVWKTDDLSLSLSLRQVRSKRL